MEDRLMISGGACGSGRGYTARWRRGAPDCGLFDGGFGFGLGEGEGRGGERGEVSVLRRFVKMIQRGRTHGSMVGWVLGFFMSERGMLHVLDMDVEGEVVDCAEWMDR
jgi:hypothetical protein